jgi:hypothetical protein
MEIKRVGFLGKIGSLTQFPNNENLVSDESIAKPPTCFITYSHEEPIHKKWVIGLAQRLQENGVMVYLDVYDLRPGMDVTRYMEEKVRTSDHVLMICTPEYSLKANAGIGGVGYEKAIVTGEIYNEEKPGKFIPILRKGTKVNALPSFLESRFYIDFCNDSDFGAKLETLLRHIFGRPEYERPPLGKEPTLPSKDVEIKTKNDSIPKAKDRLKIHTNAFRYANQTLGLSRQESENFANTWLSELEEIELKQFDKIYRYIKDDKGFTRTKSVEFSLEWLRGSPQRTLKELKIFYDFFNVELARSKEESMERAIECLALFGTERISDFRGWYNHARTTLNKKIVDSIDFAIDSVDSN